MKEEAIFVNARKKNEVSIKRPTSSILAIKRLKRLYVNVCAFVIHRVGLLLFCQAKPLKKGQFDDLSIGSNKAKEDWYNMNMPSKLPKSQGGRGGRESGRIMCLVP